ncbi:MAG: DUF2635 domain-containing protein [Pseudomonadota bacterium]|nr:DUF2635 domain-containing protein [Pseudomonadota bacterium]
MLITSVAGRWVRDPATGRPIDDTPTPIDPTDPYWARLLADGDVKKAPEAEEASPTPVAAQPPVSAVAKSDGQKQEA